MKPEAVRIALPIIKRFEGFEKVRPDGMVEAYPDPAHGWKVPTIGWGCTGPDIKRGTVWTVAQCEDRTAHEAEHAFAGALRASPGLASDPCRCAAIVDFVFNLGEGKYKASTLRKRVNERDWMSAAREIRKWVNAGGRKLSGLVLRRELEALMLERGMP